MRCKTKQRKGSRPKFDPRVSSHHVPRLRDGHSSCLGGMGGINDHRPEEIRETEFGLSPSKYEGRFRKRRRPSLFQIDFARHDNGLSTKLNQLIETKITPAVMSKAPSASRRVSFSFKTNAAITLMMMTLNPWNG